MVDHYASLGVARTSEDVVIRAAYLALMRRYHPDTNPSPDAARRVREVGTAYQLLGDKEKRAEYDRGRELEYSERRPGNESRGIPVGPIGFAATMVVLSMIILVVWLKPSRSLTPPSRVVAENLSSDGALTQTNCEWPDATKAIGREMLRQAAKLRAVDRGALSAIAPQMVVRVTPALATLTAHEPGRVNCRAAVQLTLPAGVTLPDGRQSFGGEIAYSLRGGIKGGAPKVVFGPADEIAVQMASLRRAPPASAERAVEVAAAAPVPIERNLPATKRFIPAAVRTVAARAVRVKAVARRPMAASPAPRPAAVRTVAAVVPKTRNVADTSCRQFGTRWTELLCKNKMLGALDQQLGAFDAQSLSRASAEKRDMLARSRSQFSASRSQCTTDECLRQLYLKRMKNVADIMSQGRRSSGK